MSDAPKPKQPVKTVSSENADSAAQAFAPHLSNVGLDKGDNALQAIARSEGLKTINSDTALRNDASIMRMNEQCFLMDHMQLFATQAPPSYAGLKVFTGQTSEIKRILSLVLGQKTFMHLRPNQMAMLVPELAIYLVRANENNRIGGGNEKIYGTTSNTIRKVDFANTVTDDVMADLMNPRTSKTGTLRGATLTEFFYEMTGDNHMGGAGDKQSQETRAVTLKFAAESLAALSHRVGARSASVFDLMMNPSPKASAGGMEVANKNWFMVRVAFGYSIPKTSETYFSIEQQRAIGRCKEYMIMNMSQTPKINFSEDGTVDVELSYLARIEQDPFKGTGLFDDGRKAVKQDRERKAEQDVRADQRVGLEGARERYATQLKRMIQRMDDKEWDDWFRGDNGADAEVYSEQNLIERAKHDVILKAAQNADARADDTFKNTEYDSDEKIGTTDKKIDWNKKQAAAEIERTAKYALEYQKALSAKIESEGEGRVEKYSRVMNWLLDNGKVSTILVPKESLGVKHVDMGGLGTSYNVVERQRLAAAHSLYVVAEQTGAANAWWQLSTRDDIDARTLQKYLVQSGMAPDRNSARQHVESLAEEQGITNPYSGVHKDIAIPEGVKAKMNVKHEEYKAWQEENMKAVEQRAARNAATDAPGSAPTDTPAPVDTAGQKKQKEELENQIKDNSDVAANTDLSQQQKADATAATLEGQRSSLGYVDMDDANKNIKVHYTYVGCLLEAVTHMLGGKQDGSMRNPHMLVGSLDYMDPQNPTAVRKVAITDIPVSMKMYRWWLMKYMVQPMRDYMSIDEYINLLLVELVGQVLKGDSSGCFVGAGLVNDVSPQSITREHIACDAGQSGHDRLGNLGKRFGDAKLKTLESNLKNDTDTLPLSFRAAALKKQYHYVVANAVFYVDRSKITGPTAAPTEAQDSISGKYWIAVRGDRGPVRSITFEELDAQSDNVARGGSGADDARFSSGVGYSSTSYGVKIKMLGNSLFKLGSEFYINPNAVGDIASERMAQLLGFGGYYNCKAIRGTIDETGWTTEIEGHPKGADEKQQKRLKEFTDWQSGAGALFEEQDLSVNGIYESGVAAGEDPKRLGSKTIKGGTSGLLDGIGETIDTTVHAINQGD